MDGRLAPTRVTEYVDEREMSKQPREDDGDSDMTTKTTKMR